MRTMVIVLLLTAGSFAQDTIRALIYRLAICREHHMT